MLSTLPKSKNLLRQKIILTVLLILFVISCSEDDVVNPNVDSPELTILYPLEGSQFNFGDSVIVSVTLDGIRSNSLVKSFFIVNGFIIDSTEASKVEFLLNGIDYKLGNSQLMIKSILSSGINVSDTINITISSTETPVYKPVVYNVYPHDNEAFTQGLQYHKNFLYESTGLYGQSTLRKVKLETGEVLMQKDLSTAFFGEGITIVDDKIFQLTWNEKIGFIYSIEKFDSIGSFTYETEGWGLTTNNKQFILSDGSSSLHFHDFESFAKSYSIKVTDNSSPVKWLNELELIKGDLFANILYLKHSDKIARISLSNGKVIGWIDLSSITSNHSGHLNGIAYRSDNNRLLITGKNWDSIYEIKLTAFN